MSQIISACRSEFEIHTLSDIDVMGFSGLSSLAALEDPKELKAKRREIIESVRAGKQIELAIAATTFRQGPKPNRRYLRLGGDIAKQLKTFVGQPFLVDHNTHQQSARRGTILSANYVDEGNGKFSFQMRLEVVKPDAVISVLDGTLDRFSIGWFPDGPIMCSIHGVDVLTKDSCYCYPGHRETIDGKPRIAEYEFLAWKGKEVSGVNVPAVDTTKIEDIRAALSAELGIDTKKKEKRMAFNRLAAVLGLSALDESDEGRAVTVVEGMRTSLSATQTDLASERVKVVQLEAALTVATAAGVKVQVDAILGDAYRQGRLVAGRDAEGNRLPSPREARLRRIAGERDGLASLRLELAEMPVVAKVGVSAAAGAGEQARQSLSELGAEGLSEENGSAPSYQNPYLADVASQLGLDVKKMAEFAEGMS